MIFGKERRKEEAASFPVVCMRNGVCLGIRIDGNLAQESVQSTEVRFLCDFLGW